MNPENRHALFFYMLSAHTLQLSLSGFVAGLCLFVGNLNNAKNVTEVGDTLAKFFMTKSVLVQDIRVDRSR